MDEMPDHADYPHYAGWLDSCAACVLGPCVCDPTTDAPCASQNCQQAESEDR